MTGANITIPLDPETALAYESVPAEEKRKIQALLALWLRELATRNYPTLQQVLDVAGQEAQAKGLTQDKLASLLMDE